MKFPMSKIILSIILALTLVSLSIPILECYNNFFERGRDIECDGEDDIDLSAYFPSQPELRNCIKCFCTTSKIKCRRISKCDLSWSNNPKHSKVNKKPEYHAGLAVIGPNSISRFEYDIPGFNTINFGGAHPHKADTERARTSNRIGENRRQSSRRKSQVWSSNLNHSQTTSILDGSTYLLRSMLEVLP